MATFVKTIDGNELYAKRAECDKDGNPINGRVTLVSNTNANVNISSLKYNNEDIEISDLVSLFNKGVTPDLICSGTGTASVNGILLKMLSASSSNSEYTVIFAASYSSMLYTVTLDESTGINYVGVQTYNASDKSLTPAGSTTKPVYVNSSGTPTAITGTVGTATKPVYLNAGTITAGSQYAGGTAVTLNGTSKAASTASFYAPTTSGVDGYGLSWSNGIPVPTRVKTMSEVGTAGNTDSKTDIIIEDTIICNQGSVYTIGTKRFPNYKTIRFDLRSPNAKVTKIVNNSGVAQNVYYNQTAYAITTASPVVLDNGTRSTSTYAFFTRIGANFYVTYGY